MTHRLLLSLFFAGVTGMLPAQNLFTPVLANLPHMGNSCAAWGDFDKDGDLDLAIAGETTASTAVTRLYRNDAGVFTEVPETLPGVHYPTLDWGDFDNDGFSDLLLTGTTNGATTGAITGINPPD